MKLASIGVSLLIGSFVFYSCGNKTGKEKNTITITSAGPNSSPIAAVKLMIEVGKNGKYEDLKQLCNNAIAKDQAATDWCEIANGKTDHQQDYINYFGHAVIEGEARVNSNSAEVDIKVDFVGYDSSTILLEKQGDKWFLKGYKKRL